MPILRPASRPPRVEDFALVSAFEAGARGTLLSVMPLAMIRAWGDGTAVSGAYLAVGLASLAAGLLVPAAARVVAPARLMAGAAGLYALGAALALAGGPGLTTLALLATAVATVTFLVVLSAAVLAHVPRGDLGRNESTRMLYSALAWTMGPLAGVLLLDWWRPAPFLLAGAFAAATAIAFGRLPLGRGRAPREPQARPSLAYLGRFARRPRLVAGWLLATIRSCGWAVYVVYLPLFCVESGLDEKVAGAALSASNALLFATPVMLRLVHRLSVRGAVRAAFGATAALFVAAALLAPLPWAAVACLALASGGLIVLDVCGSLPFLMAVKPSERTEMAAVYASYRDVSGILTPAAAGLVLMVAPVAGVFAACGAAMGAAWAVAGSVHPRLGRTGGRARGAAGAPA